MASRDGVTTLLGLLIGGAMGNELSEMRSPVHFTRRHGKVVNSESRDWTLRCRGEVVVAAR